MPAQFQDYYKILEVDKSASAKEIKSAYRKLAKKWHPDLQPGEKKQAAEAQFKRVNEAYEVLSDPEKRAKYDQLGSRWQNGQDFTYERQPGTDGFHYYSAEDMPGGFSDFFAQFFGGGGGGFSSARSRGRGAVRGQDIESEIELTVEEAYRGATRSFRVAGGTPCPTCAGSGVTGRGFCPGCGGTGTVTQEKTLEVKIPEGVLDGSRIRLKGQGGEGAGGGARGDLYLKVRLRSHPLYRLKGADIESDLALRPEQAVLGDKVAVQTLDGPVTVTVPAGSRSGTRLRLKEKGFPVKDGGRGNHFVRISVDIPLQLSEQEKELYRRLSELAKGGVRR
ncbi:MAG: J domain-containing protein [Bacillota bacterium]